MQSLLVTFGIFGAVTAVLLLVCDFFLYEDSLADYSE